jgi:outer membrane protein TolC
LARHGQQHRHRDARRHSRGHRHVYLIEAHQRRRQPREGYARVLAADRHGHRRLCLRHRAAGTRGSVSYRLIRHSQSRAVNHQHISRLRGRVRVAGEKVKETDARTREAKASYFPVLSNDTNAAHIAERQHLEIPTGSLGVYPQIGPLPGSAVSLAQGNANFLLSTTTVSQPLTQYFKIRAGVDVARADAAGARAEARRAAIEIAFKAKEVYYSILTTERRRDALDAQIRAAELRIVETRNAVETGVALDVKTTEVRAQIAQAKHASGQLQDAVADLKLELADLTGLPLDTELELSAPGGSGSDLAPVAERAVELALAHNPEIEAAGHQIEKARAAVSAARAEFIPEVGAFAQYIHQDGAPFISPNNGAVGLHMTWTAFEFGKRRGQVSERMAEAAQAEENLAHLRRRV